MKRYFQIFNQFLWLIAITGIFCVSGCNGNAGTTTKNVRPEIVKSYQHENFEVKLRVDTDKISIADQLAVKIEATADEDVTVQLPEFKDTIGQFNIADVSEPFPEFLDDKRVRYARTYRLKPFLSGDYMIPPVTVRFDAKNKKGGNVHEIETEAIKIRVNSVVSEGGKKTLKTIMPPEPLPETILPWLPAGIACLALIGLAGFIGFKWFNRRKNGEHGIIVRPAHEIAEEDLNRLFSEKLVEAGHFKVFYQQLSAIMRRYIENRFGLRAPEQTTEEFLNTMRTADELASAHKQLLKNFLIHCDQVKFAEYQPEPGEVWKMSEACRQFIAETRPKDDRGESNLTVKERRHAV